MVAPPKAFHVRNWFCGFEICLYCFSIDLIYEGQIAKRSKEASFTLCLTNGEKILKIPGTSMTFSELA